MAGVKQQASELVVVVRVGFDLGLVFAKTNAKQVTGHPVVFFVKYLVINVFKQLQLNGIGCFQCRFDAVDHAATNAVDKVAVKKSDRLIEFFRLLILPLAPLVRVHVGSGHTLSTVLENVQVVTASLFLDPRFVRVWPWCQAISPRVANRTTCRRNQRGFESRRVR